MRALRVWLRRVCGLFGKERRHRELAEEIQSHLQMHIEDNVRAGMTPEEARRRALIKFGSIDATQESYGDRAGVPWLETLLQDMHYGVHILRRNPGITVVAVLTLALGVAANIAMFSVADAVALRPLGVDDPDRIVRISNVKISGGYDSDSSSSWPEYEAFRSANRSLSGIAASDRRAVLLRHGDTARLLLANVVSPNYFDVLRVRPILGRVFGEGEFEVPDAPHVIMFSYDAWQREFNGDSRIVGRTVIANGLECMVIGILPRSYRGTEPILNPDVYVPLSTWYAMSSGDQKLYESRDYREFELFGRLRPGATPVQAQAQLAMTQNQMSEQFPKTDLDRLITVKLDKEQRGEQTKRSVALLFCITGLVLLIACANVTNLLLARAEARRKEMATRLAVGASRLRLVRQLLTETLLLATGATVAAYLLAGWVIRLLPSLMPPVGFPIGFDFRLDARTAEFAVVVAIVTVFIAGLVPAFSSVRTPIIAALREQAAASGGRPGRLKNVLVIAEVATSAMLLIAAGLLMRTLIAVRSQDLGFDQARKMLIVTFDATGDTLTQHNALLHRMLQQLPAIPSVESVALAGRIPMWGSGGGANKVVWIPGLQVRPGDDGVNVGYTVVSPGYFTTIGTRIVRGRGIEDGDNQNSVPVAVLNESAARFLWPQQNPLGKHFRIGGPQGKEVEVIGIAQDGHYNNVVEDQRMYMFLPMFQESYGDAVLMISTRADPRNIVRSVRDRLRSIDNNALVLTTITMDEHMRYALYENRFLVQLVSAVGLLGFVLATVGLYGVISYSVSRKTHEIGVRIALGAQPAAVFRLVVSRGLLLAGIGVGIGVAGALASMRALSSLLFHVRPTDPITFAVVSVLLLGVATAACMIPARYASKVDPTTALRYE